MNSDPVLRIRNLSVAYDERAVLQDVNIEIGRNRLVAIVGPNGAGKSTLIKATLGLIPRLTGAVELFGQPFTRADRRVGYMPQRESVDWDFPVSVLDVVLMGTYGTLKWTQRPGKAQRDRAERALAHVQLGEMRHRQISKLSGGQQQRVFLARALAQEADLYLMDEPFAGVDHATEMAIIEILREMRATGRTVVAVHHDLDTVGDYFDDVVVVNGRVVASGPVAEAFTRQSLKEAYGGRLKLLDDDPKPEAERADL